MRAPAARAITPTIHRAIRGATIGATWRGQLRGYLAGLRGNYPRGCAGEPIFRCAGNKSTSAKPLQTNVAYMPIRSLLTRVPLLTRVAPCSDCPTPRLAVASARDSDSCTREPRQYTRPAHGEPRGSVRLSRCTREHCTAEH